MNTTLRWILGSASALALAATVSVAGATPPTADIAPPKPATPVVDKGGEVYTATCAKCHGTDGKGDTKIGQKAKEQGKNWPDLTAQKTAADKVKAIITDGVADTGMKPYKDKLSAEEIDAVAKYVIGLRK
jgi:mono/diheme cytochrome c family protein